MPGNTFINFGSDVPKGESLQKDHHGDKGWIEISDWSFDIEAEHSVAKGQGASVGKATPGVLMITHYWDMSSCEMLRKMVQGRHFPLITIEMLKATGTAQNKATMGQQTYFQVKVTDAFVTKVSTKGGDDGTLNQDVEFVFKEVYVGYKPQDNTGKLLAPAHFHWSVKGNKTETSISGMST
jgi:type VI secretion system secreted protein Hcp